MVDAADERGVVLGRVRVDDALVVGEDHADRAPSGSWIRPADGTRPAADGAGFPSALSIVASAVRRHDRSRHQLRGGPPMPDRNRHVHRLRARRRPVPGGPRRQQRPSLVPAAQGRVRAAAQGAARGALRRARRAVPGTRTSRSRPIRRGRRSGSTATSASRRTSRRTRPTSGRACPGSARATRMPAATSTSNRARPSSAAGCGTRRRRRSTPFGARSTRIRRASTP